MKFAYLVPILAVSAALGATPGTPGRGAPALTPPAAPATPPWLAPGWQGEADDGDPHAGLYAAAPAPDESGTCTYDPDGEAVVTAEIDLDYLARVRRELPALAHARLDR